MIDDEDLSDLFSEIWSQTQIVSCDTFLYQVYLSIIERNDLFNHNPKNINISRLNVWLDDCDIVELEIILQILEEKERYEYCAVVKPILDRKNEKSKNKAICNKLAH